MNKTVTINLSGIVFHIDEEAYNELSKYLNAIKQSFKNTEGGEEIIADIESRIAELFKEKLATANIQVVSMIDVNEVISIMGKPEEYTETENQKKAEPETTATNEFTYASQKQMFRDTDNKIIGGVCAGLAAYFGVDPIIFRILFAILLFTGIGILLYIFLWIAIPTAKTETDKKRMRGEYYSTTKTYSYTASEKRLYRDPDDKILGGVCSGLGAYFGIDPVIFRLAFVVAFFGFGTGLLLYIILALVIPKAVTTADKLKMRGETININTIQKTFKEEFEDLKKKAKDFSDEAKELGKSPQQHKIRTFLHDFFELLMQLLRSFFKVAGKVFGGILFIASILLIVVLITVLFGFSGIYINGESQSLSHLHHFIFTNEMSWPLSLVGLSLLIGIPLLSFLLTGVKLLFNLNTPTKKIGIVFSALWIIGLGICAFQGLRLGEDFFEKGKESQTVYLQPTSSDTLFLDVKKDSLEVNTKKSFFRFNKKKFKSDHNILHFKNNQLLIANVNFDIVQSANETTTLTITKFAKGNTEEEAINRSSHIIYQTEQIDSLLLFNRYFSLAENEKWRAQKVNITLALPIGKTVYLSPAMKKIIYDIDNVSNTYDKDMVGNYWMMKPEGLTCLNYGLLQSNKDSDAKNEQAESKNFEYNNFSEIEVHGHFTINITKGDSYNVSLQGDKEDIEDVKVELNGAELKIKYDDHFNVFDDGNDITVNITTPHINRIDLSGETTSNIAGFTEDIMQVELSGANETYMEKIDIRDLNIDMAGASKLTLSGQGKNLNAELAGATSFNGIDYAVKEASIEMNGAGNAKIHATETLNLDLSGACDVKYKGEPVITKDISGPSSVEKL